MIIKATLKCQDSINQKVYGLVVCASIVDMFEVGWNDAYKITRCRPSAVTIYTRAFAYDTQRTCINDLIIIKKERILFATLLERLFDCFLIDRSV